MEKQNFTVECKIEIPKRSKKQKSVDKIETNIEEGRIPRISKLMALAIHFDQLIQNGDLKDYADIARLGYVSRARLTQIMNLNLLAPDIQEEILFLPKTINGRDPVTERQIRGIDVMLEWDKQRKIWEEISQNVLIEACPVSPCAQPNPNPWEKV